MSTPASAVTTVDSATTQQPVTTPSVPAFDAADQSTWSRGQRDNWNKTGAQPTKADSATASNEASKDKKDAAASDSATDNKEKKTSAETASESATDKDQKPHLKTKEDTDRRFSELLDELKTVRRERDELKTGKGSDTRDGKQASQPAAETYQPLTETQFFKDNPKAEYQDFLRAAAKHEAKWEIKQELAAERQRNAQAEAQKDLNSRVEEAKKRYPDFDQRIQPAVKAITEDQGIPFPVKALINDSPVFVDLMYVLGESAALADLIQTAKTNPTAALRKITLTEQLVMAELDKAKTAGADKAKDNADDGKGGDGKTRDASGKFVSSDEKKDAASETKPRAPKPPSEVGGRGTASEDALRTAAENNDFRSFEAEQTRRMKARFA